MQYPRLGDINAFGADPRRVATAGHDVDNIEPIDFSTKYKNQNDAFTARFDSLGSKFNGKSLDDYVNGKSFCCTDKNLDEIEKNNTQTAENAKLEDNLYFYHPDHLGSTNLITNYDGEVTQNVAYIPYGEVFVEERNGNWASPFLFNAKELDEETGLYYYGARYLNPTDCRWLAVDQMFEKYPGMSPYNYCAGNPVKMVDPDGRVLKHSSTNSKSFHDDWNATTKFMKEKDTYWILQRIDNIKGVVITIQESNGKSYFDPKTNTIYWDSRLGVITDNGVIMSPATVLNHEADHAIRGIEDPEGKKVDKKQLDEDYHNCEEERVITTSEQITAKKHGEIEDGETTRSNHNGQPYRTTSPTTTEGSEEIIITPSNN